MKNAIGTYFGLGRLMALSLVLALMSCGTAAADWPTYGHDLSNSRNAGSAGPSATAVRTLMPAWKFDSSNGDFTGTPVVAAGTLVAGTNLGSIYALDAVTGKLRWSREVGQQINGSAAIDLRAPGGPTVFVPVAQLGQPRLLALSLTTGALRWQRVLTRQDGADVFGSPMFWRGTVFMGTSGPNTDDATARGTISALDEKTGRFRWQTYTVPRGDDGGAVWTTPAIDTATRHLYIGTGNAYHAPAANTTDAMLVLNASNGRILRHFQTVPGDVWELQNPTAGPDYDFGSSPNLITSPGGRPLVGEGSKSGTYWALDRSTMRPVWHRDAGPGSQLDGGVNSTAYDGTRIYGSDAIDSQIFALGRGGLMQWNSLDVGSPHFSPVAAGNGIVYSSDPSGFLTARDGATGTLLTKVPLGTPNFGGVSVVGRAVYVATGTGPPPSPDSSIDTSQMDGQGSIVALGDTSQSGPGGAANTFAGTCQLSGTVHFDPPMTNAPQQGQVSGSDSGTCSGTLTDGRGRSRSLNDEPVTSEIHSAGTESCAAGQGEGTGYIAFGGQRIAFTYTEVRTGPALVLKIAGARGGSGTAEGNVSPSANPADVAAACGGSGLTQAPIDARVATPGMSG